MLHRDYKIKYKQQVNGQSSPFYFSGSIRLKVVIVALFTLTSLVFTQLIFANSLATDGDKLSQVQQEIAEIEKENMSLQAEIAEISSFTKLTKYANDNGFTKPKSVTTVEKF